MGEYPETMALGPVLSGIHADDRPGSKLKSLALNTLSEHRFEDGAGAVGGDLKKQLKTFQMSYYGA